MDRPDLGADVEKMTAYCTYCPKMCRFSCPAAAAEGRETVTPWGMMRLLELARDGSVPLDAEVAEIFHHCTGCRRCQTWCKHGNDVPHALWKARQWAAEQGLIPQALRALGDRFDEHQRPFYQAPPPIDEEPFDDTSPIAYWPDCSTAQHHPQLVTAIGRLLHTITGSPVRLIRSQATDASPCCGFPLSAAGLADRRSLRHHRWPALDGVQSIISDCPALAAWHHDHSSWPTDDEPTDDEPTDEPTTEPVVQHLFDFLAPRLSHHEPANPIDASRILLHHSCYVTRQIDGGDHVRAIIDHICDTPPLTMAYDGDESPCCGGRHHYRAVEPAGAHQAARRVFTAIDRHDEAQTMMTTASHCRHALGEAGDHRQITSLLEMICDAYGCIK